MSHTANDTPEATRSFTRDDAFRCLTAEMDRSRHRYEVAAAKAEAEWKVYRDLAERRAALAATGGTEAS
jgi:hypothetical protein